jgi:hypothetical protein
MGGHRALAVLAPGDVGRGTMVLRPVSSLLPTPHQPPVIHSRHSVPGQPRRHILQCNYNP